MDPLSADYAAWTPYAFAMNRVIDGIDLDGLEWTSSKEGNEVTIKLHMTVVLKSETIQKLTISEQNKLLSDYTARAQSILNDNLRDFTGQDGSTFKFELTHERLSKETKLTEEHFFAYISDTEFTVDDNGMTTFTGGSTYLGGFQGKIRVNYAAVNTEDPTHVILTADLGQKLIHEILHKAGLLHPWDSNADADIQQDNLIEKIGKPEARKEIKDNVMNSEENKLESFKGTSGEKLTKNQKENFTDNFLEYTDEKPK